MVVGLAWRQPDAREVTEVFQVLRFRNGRVVDIEDHRDRRRALRRLPATPA